MGFLLFSYLEYEAVKLIDEGQSTDTQLLNEH